MNRFYPLYFRILLLFLLIQQVPALAQVTLRGKVTDGISKEPLIGATVVLKGKGGIGVATDVNGAYELIIKKEPPFTVVVGYVGYQPKEIEIYEEEAELNISLKSRQVLSEVVVTAVGLESSRKSINYSLSEVKGTELLQSREPNLTTALSGKVAGVQIGNSGGAPGGSSSVRIRGNTSVLGNNSPLFVVDGIPIDNSIQDLLPNITNSVSLATPSNRAIDINSDDVESITVLKGPTAAALYGLRAANGAVIINTKRGSKLTDKPVTVSVTASIQVDEQNRRLQPRQHKFSNGFNGRYLLPGQATSDENWGALLDTLTYSSLPSQFDRNGQIVGAHDPASNGKAINRYDNEENFFVKGITQNYHVSVAGKADKASYYASAGRLYQTGIVPTTDFYRTTFRFNADYDVTDKFKLSAGINHINSGSNNKSLNGGYGTNAIRALRNSPDNFDITNGLSEPWNNPDSYKLPPTVDRPWGASRAYAAGNGWDNPYWSVNMNPQKNDVDRFLGYGQADYQVLDWLKATFRYGVDSYRDLRNSGFSRGTNGVGAGVVNVVNFIRKDYNTDFILSANKKLTDDLDLTLNLGHNYYDSYRYQTNTRGDGLIIPGLFNFTNASSTSTVEQTVRRKLVATYGSANLAYKNWLFLNVTGRNEWSSTLPEGKNSFLYPSVGAAFVFTDAFDLKSRLLSFGKVRLSYARVGNDTEPYSLDTYYNPIGLVNNSLQSAVQTPFNGLPGLGYGNNSYGLSNVIGNQQLAPEQITSWEAGLELKFLKNRIGLDVAVYDNRSRNQIIPVSLPGSTGYLATVKNSGEVSNRGVELALNFTPIQNRNLIWDVSLIYYKNENRVVSLAPGLNSVSLGGVFSDSRAIVGQPYGVMVATDLLRNSEGKPIIDDQSTLANGQVNTNYGYPLVNPTPAIVGDPNPKGNASLRNSLSYKFITLSVLLDTRYGFDITNAPHLQMVFNGVDESTEQRGQTTIFEGVKKSEGTPNDIPAVLSQNWYRSTFNIPGMYVEKDLYWLRIKDVNLSFALPAKWLTPLKISSTTLTLTARNWLISTNYSGSDPDLGSRTGQWNALGSDFWTTPNTHSYGASLNVTF
jgi:TonB-linked SusC/RagA family outer membrane protein